MFVVMGASGHVGAAVVEILLERGQAVTAVTHDEAHVERLRRLGAAVAIADVRDPESLRRAFTLGRRAFLLNPPADVKLDTDEVESAGVAGILAALTGSGLEKVVAESTAGAEPGEGIGDASVLWNLEQGLLKQPIPAAINRAPFYMSNWDVQLKTAAETGRFSTMLPADLRLPMAAPVDLGRAAADRLMSGLDDVGIRYVDGPARYSAEDVAAILSRKLGRKVMVDAVPRKDWKAAYRALGFSERAAQAYTKMSAAALENGFGNIVDPIIGSVTLDDYLSTVAGPTP